MYKVIVDALSMVDYFEYKKTTIFDTHDYIEIDVNFMLSKPNFHYYPTHYGLVGNEDDYDYFDEYLIKNNQLIRDDTVCFLSDLKLIDTGSFFEYDEVLTFEFETEEEALYFNLKYC